MDIRRRQYFFSSEPGIHVSGRWNIYGEPDSEQRYWKRHPDPDELYYGINTGTSSGDGEFHRQPDIREQTAGSTVRGRIDRACNFMVMDVWGWKYIRRSEPVVHVWDCRNVYGKPDSQQRHREQYADPDELHNRDHLRTSTGDSGFHRESDIREQTAGGTVHGRIYRAGNIVVMDIR